MLLIFLEVLMPFCVCGLLLQIMVIGYNLRVPLHDVGLAMHLSQVMNIQNLTIILLNSRF